MNAKSWLSAQTIEMLLKDCEDARRYRGQMLEPVEFVRSVAEHLYLISEDFPAGVVESAIECVEAAFAELAATEPVEFQRAFSWRSWQHEGVRIQ
jgi:hypothetical protein